MQTIKGMVSIVIPTYNMAHLIVDTLQSCQAQDYRNMEIVVYDDCSTDGTDRMFQHIPYIRYFRGNKNLGVGEAINEGIKRANGDYIVIMCSDDLFVGNKVISDIVARFKESPDCGHISRWYHQFEGQDRTPVRAWRTDNVIVQANNPSGLAFRRTALEWGSIKLFACAINKYEGAKHGNPIKASNKMFIEAASLVYQVALNRWKTGMLMFDTVAVRIHNSTSIKKETYKKFYDSSPIENWCSIGGWEMLTDYFAFIQIKNGHTMLSVVQEICNYVRLRPKNLLAPMFWICAIGTLVTPRFILRKLPHLYRKYVSSKLTGKGE